MKLVHRTESVKRMYQVTYETIYHSLPIASSTYRRWRLRMLHGEDPVKKPGPKVLKPLDVEKLNNELMQLVHGRKRSRGIGKVRIAVKDFISRRELCDMIAQMRRDRLRQKLSSQINLCWRVPGSVWSMDIFETCVDHLPGKQFVLCVADLASGYKLIPLAAEKEHRGHEIRVHLKKLFEQFGRPLFLKRDNGGNLNHSCITDLLSQSHVLPLNSPCYYAPYNGAIEHGLGEIKWKLKQEYGDVGTFGEFARSIELAAHDLNHINRRKLGGDTSCRRFFDGPGFNFSKRKRKEVFIWISECSFDIMEKAGKKMMPDAAYRIACQIWLVKNNLLSVSKNGGVLPHCSGNSAHN